jgi:hypothetical protein
MSAVALERLAPWREEIPPEELADALAQRAVFLNADGDRARAAELAREALELARVGESPAGEVCAAMRKVGVGLTLARTGLEPGGAEEILLGAHATLLAQFGPAAPHTNWARAALHELYTLLERPADAARYAAPGH